MKLKVLGAAVSFFITVLYVTGCGREGKILITDNYKAQPIALSHAEASNDGKSGTGFSTDVTKAQANLNISSVIDFTKFANLNFGKNDVIDCRARNAGPGQLEISIRFSNPANGSFAATYITDYDSKATDVRLLESKELTRVSYQDSGRNTYLTATKLSDASCSLQTALVKNSEIRGNVGCDLRGTDITNVIQLNGSFTCHILGAM